MSYVTPQIPPALRRLGRGLIQLALILAIITNVLIITPAVIAGLIFQMHEPIVFVIVASAVGWVVIWGAARLIQNRHREQATHKAATSTRTARQR